MRDLDFSYDLTLDEAREAIPGHVSGPAQPEDAVGRQQTGGATAAAQQQCKWRGQRAAIRSDEQIKLEA